MTYITTKNYLNNSQQHLLNYLLDVNTIYINDFVLFFK